ncbi:hypothetical protein ACFOEE_12660 [Pseudoalteromonas fenneropenaei]|uniref:Uncharacterized protein n=1 Tax=Pseudoalteromonas fenneropenaei TaxID=1737459 RepID=A0ABV7CLP2_9GAMM
MKQLVSALLLTLVSLPCMADFTVPGNGKVGYPTGAEKPFEFGFAWQAETGQFSIGSKSYEMDLPESYSVALTLSKDDSKVWVQEFTPGFIESFEWQIGEHLVSLKKKQFSQPVKGDYVLTLNGIDYFLARNNISITITFNQQGVEDVKLDGVTKDMGTKQ